MGVALPAQGFGGGLGAHADSAIGDDGLVFVGQHPCGIVADIANRQMGGALEMARQPFPG